MICRVKKLEIILFLCSKQHYETLSIVLIFYFSVHQQLQNNFIQKVKKTILYEYNMSEVD